MKTDNFSEVYRHSMAHILAKSIVEIFEHSEDVQLAIGPQINDGFYYDFLLPRSLTPEDFPVIENKMREILKRKEDFIYREVSKTEALSEFSNQKYKKELINDLPEDAVISIYDTGDDFKDLCKGPHVGNSAELLSCAFKIKSVSSAYWKGDEKNDTLLF